MARLMHRTPWRAKAAVVALFLGHATASGAQTAAPAQQQSPTPGQSGAGSGAGESATAASFWTRDKLLGDIGGLRTVLDGYGISLGLQETSEVIGNATGGLHRGAAYEGLALMTLGLDTGKRLWPGGTFNISAFQIHGRNLGVENAASLQPPSSIAAQRATRLWELWYQQSLLGGRLDLKLGQQSIDQEFMVSQYSGLFLNTVMGWPVIPSIDLYAGGPAYPLSSPGIRIRAQPAPDLTFLAGVFDDNPPGGPLQNDLQVRGAEQSGTRFNLGTGALFIAELQVAINEPPPAETKDAKPAGLPGTYKVGFWYDSGPFADQRFDAAGLSLADPAGSGMARLRQHDFSIYALADQMVWRPAPDGAQALGAFARIMGAPGDRNLVSFGLDVGATLKAPLPGRDNDSVGIGYGLAKVSGRASALNQDTAFHMATPTPVRSTESFVELTYQAQIAPWWQVQPDFQYVFTPGGGIPDLNQPGKRVGNEAIFGLRTNVAF